MATASSAQSERQKSNLDQLSATLPTSCPRLPVAAERNRGNLAAARPRIHRRAPSSYPRSDVTNANHPLFRTPLPGSRAPITNETRTSAWESVIFDSMSFSIPLSIVPRPVFWERTVGEGFRVTGKIAGRAGRMQCFTWKLRQPVEPTFFPSYDSGSLVCRCAARQ